MLLPSFTSEAWREHILAFPAEGLTAEAGSPDPAGGVPHTNNSRNSNHNPRAKRTCRRILQDGLSLRRWRALCGSTSKCQDTHKLDKFVKSRSHRIPPKVMSTHGCRFVHSEARLSTLAIRACCLDKGYSAQSIVTGSFKTNGQRHLPTGLKACFMQHEAFLSGNVEHPQTQAVRRRM